MDNIKNESPFEIGDIISYIDEIIRIFEGECYGSVISSNELNLLNGKYYTTSKCPRNAVYDYIKATPEQEYLFRKRCLKEGVWFDKRQSKWINLTDGGTFTFTLTNDMDLIIIMKEYKNKSLYNYAILEPCGKLHTDKNLIRIDDKILSISEATEEEKQKLYDALKAEGKKWDAEEKCIKDSKWIPRHGEDYWYISDLLEVGATKRSFPSDDRSIEVGNCFKSFEEAEKFAKYIRECFKNYKQE